MSVVISGIEYAESNYPNGARKMIVYVLEMLLMPDRVKIGISKHPSTRTKQINKYAPAPVALAAMLVPTCGHVDARGLEGALLCRFPKAHHEWRIATVAEVLAAAEKIAPSGLAVMLPPWEEPL